MNNLEDFNIKLNNGDVVNANNALMRELANILIKQREDFIFLLKESGVNADNSMDDGELIKLFIDNIGKNKKLTLGASFLIASHNKTLGFDGQEEISDNSVKRGYLVMSSYFDAESHSNAVGAIAGAIQGVSQLGSTLAQGRQKKKYGVTDMLNKKAEAQAEMSRQVAEQRKAQIDALNKEKENKAKTTKIILISVASLVGLTILGTVIYVLKTKK